jgi:hypothetical protein
VLFGKRVRLQNFDCNLAIELGIKRQIDFAHPACAQLFDYPIVRDGFSNH